jgi:Fructose-2,6-bisphosphatase
MGKIYMVRHGETQWNTEGRIQGQTNIPLSEVGKNQARLAADRLSTVTFDAVYSSDLDRTLETR